MNRSVLVLNIKLGHVDRVNEALGNNRILIGWGDAEGLLDQTLGHDQVRSMLHQTYYYEETSFVKAGFAPASMSKR
jgi:hypothetical protein